MLVTESNATFSGDLLEIWITSTPALAHTVSAAIQKTSDDWETLQASLEELIEQLIPSYLFLFVAGLICSLLTVALLYVLIASPRMRKESRFLIFLAFGDLSNCMGLSLLGIYRYTLFLRCTELKQTPMETSLTCAAKPFVWFRIIGNIWPPLMLILISFDRLIITWMPLLYNRWLKGKGIYTCIFSIIFVIVFCLIGAALAIKHREEPVKFDCGRKAAFSVTFATVIYYFETLGYGAAFILNFVAYVRAKSIVTSDVVREQLKRTRVFLAVNILSVLLVITPNLKSLSIHMLRYIGMSENLFLMVNLASLINSSFNIFIYIALYQSFRTELVYALGIHLIECKLARVSWIAEQSRSNVMSQRFLPVGAYEREVMSDGVIVYLILTIMGICCFFINVPLLYILLKSPRCRTDSKLVICLVCGDMFNCLAITVMSYTRRDLYKEGLRTGLLVIQTQETCARQPSMWLRLIGNVWPPTIQLIMGIERTLACWSPVFYSAHIRKRSIWGCFISIAIVMVFCGTAAITAFIFPRNDTVKFDCGRKATFTRTYSKIVYYFEIFGYVIGLLLNAAAYFRCKSVMVNNIVSRQVRQIRYYLTIAVISTLLVAMPDTKQIILGFLRNKKNALHDWLSQLFNTMSLIASSNSLFIYLALSKAFRREFFKTFSTQTLIKRRPPVSTLFVRWKR